MLALRPATPADRPAVEAIWIATGDDGRDARGLQAHPELLAHLAEIEACHSVAGAASYLLLVRVATPRHLESLLREVRAAANVSTRTTVVLQTFYENRPVAPAART